MKKTFKLAAFMTASALAITAFASMGKIAHAEVIQVNLETGEQTVIEDHTITSETDGFTLIENEDGTSTITIDGAETPKPRVIEYDDSDEEPDYEDDFTSIQPVSEIAPLFRLYNPNSGEHHYTLDANEKSYLVSIGWNDEGIGWNTPTSGKAVYRLYNPNAAAYGHHYTTDREEAQYLVNIGWNYEGIGWRSETQGNAVYRLYNPNSGEHFYTLNKGEKSYLASIGWNDEGIGFYAVQDNVKTTGTTDTGKNTGTQNTVNNTITPVDTTPIENTIETVQDTWKIKVDYSGDTVNTLYKVWEGYPTDNRLLPDEMITSIVNEIKKGQPFKIKAGTLNDFTRSFLELYFGDFYQIEDLIYATKVEADDTLTATIIPTAEMKAKVNGEAGGVAYLKELYKWEQENILGLSKTEAYKKIADYICDLAMYDYSTMGSGRDFYQGAYWGAKVEGKFVCHGYAQLNCLMCTMAGIPCKLEMNNSHIWNIVTFNGKEYRSDLTWKDSGTMGADQWYLFEDLDYEHSSRGEVKSFENGGWFDDWIDMLLNR